MMPRRIKAPIILSTPSLIILLIVFSFTAAEHSHANSPLPDAEMINPHDVLNQPTLSAEELREIQVRQGAPRIIATPTPTRTPTPINIGNFVWDDLDKDGRQDAGEPGLAGITVQLWNSTKTQLLYQAITNSSGIYKVIAPLPGNYRVRVLLPSALDQFTTKDAAGGDNQLDSDINPTGTNFGFTDIFPLASNVISTTIMDAGIIIYRPPTPTRTPTPISIGNFVWNDYNGDGRQDAGEDGLVGITVQLWNSSKTYLLDQTVTGPTGIYRLVAPLPGNYRVRVLAPVGASFTLKDQGADTLDSDFNPGGVNSGFTDVYTLASNVISITSIDAGLINVPPTPTPTLTFTPSTPTATPTAPDTTATAPSESLTDNDTVALYSKKLNMFSLVDTLQPVPAPSNFQLFSSSSPEKGKFVMGDWDGDGQKTPGLFKEKFFRYTNQLGADATWFEVKIGDFGKIAVVAGRFSSVVTHDCFGVVQLEGVQGHNFALHYTCELNAAKPPSGIMMQWIDITLNGEEKYQFAAGDWNADGLDSIAVRRGKKIKWGNIAPSQGPANFAGIQKFIMSSDSYGALVSGDWNGDGFDTFGIYAKGDGSFYYRNDLAKDKLTPLQQNLGLPIGKAVASSWRNMSGFSGTDLLGLPEAMLPLDAGMPEMTPSAAATPSRP
jgi:hypothetical protein